MNKLTFIVFALTIVMLHFATSSLGQEYIVKVNPKTKIYKAKDLIIAGNYAKFYDTQLNKILRMKVSNFLSLNFVD